MQPVILALDISTAIIGWAVLPVGAPNLTYPLQRGHIDLRKVKGLWAKLDVVRSQLESDVKHRLATKGLEVKQLFVEEPLKKFRRGSSSANTISLLARMNAVTSFMARELFRLEPLFIDATDARRKIGVRLLSRKKSGGRGQKEQCFEFLCTNVFDHEVWPLNKNGKVQPHCFDEVDAYVIALAGALGLGEP